MSLSHGFRIVGKFGPNTITRYGSKPAFALAVLASFAADLIAFALVELVSAELLPVGLAFEHIELASVCLIHLAFAIVQVVPCT